MKHTVNLNNEQFNIEIKIRLDDECKNGHQDFSITGTIWEVGQPRIERHIIACGCVHDAILAACPELSDFVALHLCGFDGVPMHAVANMCYHLENGFNSTKVNDENFASDYCDYYRITKAEFDALFAAKMDKLYFQYVFESLPIRARWKEEAQASIKHLEELTGETFVNTSTRSNFTQLNGENRALIFERIESGYYTPEPLAEREAQAKEDAKEKFFSELDERLEYLIENERKEIAIKKQLYLLGGKRFVDNVIYYKHDNTLKCNWRTHSNDELNDEEVDLIHSTIKLEQNK